MSFCMFSARRVPQPLSKSTNALQAISCFAFTCALSETCALRQLQSVSVLWLNSISASRRPMLLWKRACRKHHIIVHTLHTFTYNLAHQQMNPQHPHLRGVCYESRFFVWFRFVFGDSTYVHLVVDWVVGTLGYIKVVLSFSVFLCIYMDAYFSTICLQYLC